MDTKLFDGLAVFLAVEPILIRAEALEHLLAVELKVIDPDVQLLHSEFVKKEDFRIWLVHTGRTLPKFWFAQSERYVER